MGRSPVPAKPVGKVSTVPCFVDLQSGTERAVLRAARSSWSHSALSGWRVRGWTRVQDRTRRALETGAFAEVPVIGGSHWSAGMDDDARAHGRQLIKEVTGPARRDEVIVGGVAGHLIMSWRCGFGQGDDVPEQNSRSFVVSEGGAAAGNHVHVSGDNLTRILAVAGEGVDAADDDEPEPILHNPVRPVGAAGGFEAGGAGRPKLMAAGGGSVDRRGRRGGRRGATRVC